ncbi:MAG TPA: cyclic nucleotide-binding domain-containing protein [bacterium]|nr:cyclic nucleotide-binding domain-containing protein [bacterium]
MQNIDVIRATSLFEGVGEEALAVFAKNAIASSYGAKSVIAAEGSLGDCLFIIKSGSVDVILNRDTKGAVKIAELAAGDFAGEMSLIDSQPRSASLIARQDTKVLIITRAALLDLHSKDFDAFMRIIVNITRRIGNRLRETDKVLANIAR